MKNLSNYQITILEFAMFRNGWVSSMAFRRQSLNALEKLGLLTHHFKGWFTITPNGELMLNQYNGAKRK